MKDPPRPTKATMQMDYPWVIVRFRCHHCERSRDARLAILAARFGPNTMIEELLRIFMGRCPWDPYSGLHKPRKYGHRCGAYCPDLLRSGPPDLPPAMGGLTVIEGGKDERRPAERTDTPLRRRVGGEDV